MNLITKEMIRQGSQTNVIRLEADPNGSDGRGTVCTIGDYWFYFGGLLAEELTPDEYRENVPMEEIIDEIYRVLDDFRGRSEFEDEYNYYLSVLLGKYMYSPVLTNADRIRSMSNEQLAVFIDELTSRCFSCMEDGKNTDCPIYSGGRYCERSDVIRWVQEPVEEEL